MSNQNVWTLVAIVAGFAILYILYLQIQLAILRHRIVVVSPPPAEESGTGCLGILLLLIVLAAIAFFLLAGSPP